MVLSYRKVVFRFWWKDKEKMKSINRIWRLRQGHVKSFPLVFRPWKVRQRAAWHPRRKQDGDRVKTPGTQKTLRLRRRVPAKGGVWKSIKKMIGFELMSASHGSYLKGKLCLCFDESVKKEWNPLKEKPWPGPATCLNEKAEICA